MLPKTLSADTLIYQNTDEYWMQTKHVKRLQVFKNQNTFCHSCPRNIICWNHYFFSYSPHFFQFCGEKDILSIVMFQSHSLNGTE